MNYDQEINKLVEAIKADKSIVQPWRNKSVARLEEVQAFVRMGLTTAYPGQVDGDSKIGQSIGCTCPSGARDSYCPVHGTA